MRTQGVPAFNGLKPTCAPAARSAKTQHAPAPNTKYIWPDIRLRSTSPIQSIKSHLLLQNVSLTANLSALFLNAYSYSQSCAGILLATTASFAFTSLMSYLALWQTRAAATYQPPKASIYCTEQPRVALAATALNEPGEVVAQTLRAFAGVEYKNADLFLLDDSPVGSPAAREYKEVVSGLSSSGIHVTHVRRKDDPLAFHGGAKAGNINYFLNTYGKNYIYYSPFDADFRPDRDFLERTVPIMESPENKDISILQTGQRFEEPNSVIEKANSVINAINYDIFARSKDAVGLGFWFGSSALVRIEDLFRAARQRGTPDQPVRMETLTEDQDTSLGLGLGKTRYLDEYLSTGLVPPTLIKYLKQHRRWTIGGTDLMFKRLLPLAWRDLKQGEFRRALSVLQDGIYRIAPFQHFLMGSGALAFWGANSRVPNYSLLMMSAFFCLAANYLPSIYRGRIKGASFADVMQQLDLHTISAPMHIEAVTKSVTGKKMAFETTNAKQVGRERLPLKWLIPILAGLGANLVLFTGVIGEIVYRAYNLTGIGTATLVTSILFILNGIRTFGRIAEFNDGWKTTFCDLWIGGKKLIDNFSDRLPQPLPLEKYISSL